MSCKEKSDVRDASDLACRHNHAVSLLKGNLAF